MHPVDRAGTFRGNISEYGLKEFESGSVAVAIRVYLTEYWNDIDKVWVEWHEFDHEAHGDIVVVKKDKTINQNAASSLIRYAGWDGDIESIQSSKWTPTPIQVVIKEDTYNGETRLKIAFVNEFARTPGGLGANMSPEKARQLQTQFGASLRAIAGSVKMNGTKPSGSPVAPPPRQSTPATAPAAQHGEDIPF